MNRIIKIFAFTLAAISMVFGQSLLSINTETNQLVLIDSIGNCNVVGSIGVACGKYGGLDFDPSGNLWFLPVNASADTVLVRINYSTGNILQT
jgi:hypothetical protein